MNDEDVSRGTKASNTGAPISRDLPEWPTQITDLSGPLSQKPEDVRLRMYDYRMIAALRARLELAVGELERLHQCLPGKPIEAGGLWNIIVACREPRT